MAYDLGAFNADSRAKTDEIADRLNLDSAQLKEPIAELVKVEKLLESKTGRGGGVWLTDMGKSTSKNSGNGSHRSRPFPTVL
jgi:DNA-binding IscR family transcriptional regulator